MKNSLHDISYLFLFFTVCLCDITNPFDVNSPFEFNEDATRVGDSIVLNRKEYFPQFP